MKKLGCLFEAFLGALFLDFNKINVEDEKGWFKNIFQVGPGFQMAQIFVETVFDKHVDFVKLIKTDDNYKNILQVKIQKEFKITPDYLEISHDVDKGYEMGVYICLNESIHNTEIEMAEPFSNYGSFNKITEYNENNNEKPIFIFLGSATHKIKKKAEQLACERALDLIE